MTASSRKRKQGTLFGSLHTVKSEFIKNRLTSYVHFVNNTFNIFVLRRHQWKLSMLCSLPLVSVCSSELYRKMLDMYALKSFNFALMLIFLMWKVCFIVLRASMANPFLCCMSFVVSNLLPRNLQFLQLSLLLYSILYFFCFVFIFVYGSLL